MKVLKHKIYYWLTSFFMVVALFSCTPKELAPNDLIQYVENPDNGFIKEKILGELAFRVRYKPLSYIISKNNAKEIITDSIYKASEEKLKGLQYVNLTIYPTEGKQFDVLKYGTGSQQEDQQKIYYYSYTFQEDIYIEQGDKKLPCKLFHFVRDHGLSPELNFALGFDAMDVEGDIKIVINDYVFGNGELNFIIKEKDIKRLPVLKV
jgi:hypothetical protein